MYSKIKKIGSGTFGNVWLVSREDKLFAMKRVPCDPENPRPPVEIDLLKQLDSPYIVKYHDSFVEKTWLCIIMDYCQEGDLQKRIIAQRSETEGFTERQILEWFTQLTLALQHMHKANVLHRDLKPQNIFLTSDKTLKIGDFGISRKLEQSQMALTSLGTPYYLSPEVCLGQPYNTQSDMWMLGCCLYELATLQRPFTGSNLNQIVVNILNKPFPEVQSSGLISKLIGMLLQKNALMRATASEILLVPEIAQIANQLTSQCKQQQNPKRQLVSKEVKNNSILFLIQNAKSSIISPTRHTTTPVVLPQTEPQIKSASQRVQHEEETKQLLTLPATSQTVDNRKKSVPSKPGFGFSSAEKAPSRNSMVHRSNDGLNLKTPQREDHPYTQRVFQPRPITSQINLQQKQINRKSASSVQDFDPTLTRQKSTSLTEKSLLQPCGAQGKEKQAQVQRAQLLGQFVKSKLGESLFQRLMLVEANENQMVQMLLENLNSCPEKSAREYTKMLLFVKSVQMS